MERKEGIKIWNKPTKLQLEKIPDAYSQENVQDKKIYMKFFMGGWTWYIAEIDHKNWDTMFCYVISPMSSGEWGYTSLRELMSIKSGYMEVDRELHGITPLTPKRFSEIKRGMQ